MEQSKSNAVVKENLPTEEVLKERWEKMEKSVQSNVDYMDANHWMYLNTAIEQLGSFMCLPNGDISYRKAFVRLNKEVKDNYVTSDNPEEDGFEETYHLLKYFENGFNSVQSFNTYMRTKKALLKERK